MKKLIVISALCLLYTINNHFLFASDNGNNSDLNLVSLSGQVIDQNSGEALAGVLVNIEEAENKLYTDFEGKFKVQGLLPGNYILNTSMISYEDSKVELELNWNHKEPVKIMLNQATLK